MKKRKTHTVIGFSNEEICRHVVEVLRTLWIGDGVDISSYKEDDRRYMVTAIERPGEHYRIRDVDVDVMNAQAYAVATSYTRLKTSQVAEEKVTKSV